MENNGMQPPQPTSPVQPGMDVQSPQTPAASAGWPSAAPPPATGVGSGAPAPGVAPVVAAPAPAASTPAPASGMASAPAAWGVPANQTPPTPTPAPAAPAPSSAPDLVAAPTPAPAPAPAPADVVTPAAEGQTQEKPTDEHNPMAIPADAKAKHKAPIGVIVGTLVVAVLLAAVAVFAYMKMEKKPTSQKINVPIIGASDVDKTQTQIDDSLEGIDDTKDFAPSDLSDAALGL